MNGVLENLFSKSNAIQYQRKDQATLNHCGKKVLSGISMREEAGKQTYSQQTLMNCRRTSRPKFV